MRSAKSVQNDIYARLEQVQIERDRTKKKQSFWPTDGLKPLNELWWAWMGVPKTNPISPEKLAMFQVAKLCELHLCREMVKTGFAADLDNPEHVAQVEAHTGRALQFAKEKDEFGQRQIRVEMEREFVPVTGYMDGITLRGEPIEIKSTRSTKYIKDVATGRPPQIEHVYQLATYMDYIGSKVGWLAIWERAGGSVFFVRVEHLGDLVYATTDYSLGLPEEMQNAENPIPVNPDDMTTLTIDLGAEYKRWRKLFEDYIHPQIEPPLQFEYAPKITKELLDSYVTDGGDDKKIRAAIRGNRILSQHGWKPQYCDWRDLWIQKESEQKGVKPDELLSYTQSDIQFMLNYLDAELIDGKVRKITDTRRKQIAQEKRDRFRKGNPQIITDQRRKAGIKDNTPIAALLPFKLAEFIRLGCVGAQDVQDLDRITDTELLSIQGIGAGAVKKIREATKTFDPDQPSG